MSLQCVNYQAGDSSATIWALCIKDGYMDEKEYQFMFQRYHSSRWEHAASVSVLMSLKYNILTPSPQGHDHKVRTFKEFLKVLTLWWLCLCRRNWEILPCPLYLVRPWYLSLFRCPYLNFLPNPQWWEINPNVYKLPYPKYYCTATWIE